jgi:hypothetical protein
MMLSVVLLFYCAECCYADSGGGEEKGMHETVNWNQDSQYYGIQHNDILHNDTW